MKLFVGLGNPGAQYSHNRHNIGFMVVDALARAHGFPAFRGKMNGELTQGQIDGEKVILLKPMTFMNNSGQSVRAVADFYKIALGDIVVFHDELDLPAFKLRIKTGGGAAGHNGLKSLDSHLGAGYQRVRVGIGRPAEKSAVYHYVLGDFAKSEGESLAILLDALCAAAGFMARGDMARVQNDVARALGKEGGGEKPVKPSQKTPEKPVKDSLKESVKQLNKAISEEFEESQESQETLSPLQRLARKFMG